ncbi:MAG: transposase, partial [Bacteroidaceae bacterium]|nr:transposase [Bacteroidaceae bacterium]
MASKTRYTEEFKKKVVEEYKKGDLSLEEIATKYGLPPALL